MVAVVLRAAEKCQLWKYLWGRNVLVSISRLLVKFGTQEGTAMIG